MRALAKNMNIHLIYVILISAALALGIYGVVVQRGANLVRIDGRTAQMALIWAAFQLLAALAGYGIGSWILHFELERDRSIFWIHILAGVILAGIGVRMLLTAFKKKTFLEHRMENIDIREDTLLSLRMCVHGCFAGIACGLLRLGLVQMLVCTFVISALFAVAGYISGRAWGAEPRDKAYALTSQMILGSAKLQLETGEHPGLLKDKVCSPAGTTIRGVDALEHMGIRAAMIDAIDAIM